MDGFGGRSFGAIGATAALALALSACSPAADENLAGTGGDSGGGAGGDVSGGGSGGGGGAGGSGGGIQAPEPGDALVFRSTKRLVLLDTARPADGLCGTFSSIGATRQLVVDLDDCDFAGAVPADAAGLLGSVTLLTTSADTMEVRLFPSGAADTGLANVVGPLQSATHGFLTLLGSDRAFVLDVSGTASADVRVEVTTVLVPEASGGQYVHLLDQPLRWFAANPNDDGFRDVWPKIESVLRYPVLEAEQGATGMFGAVHLGPNVWRDERVTFHMGEAGPDTPENGLARWASVPVDGHFPWRYSSLFMTGASAAQEIELRASAANTQDYGPEPWIDTVGWLSPDEGLVYRHLDRALEFDPMIQVNDEDYRFETGLGAIGGVVGTLEFDLPHFPYDDHNRWFFVMVGATADTFGGALGGGLEGPDWMTAGLNQNGRVSVRFVAKTDEEAAFVMRHYSFLAGGAAGQPSDFDVTVKVRIEGVLATP